MSRRWSRAVGFVVAAFSGAALIAAPVRVAASQQIAVKAGVSITPDSVRIGDAFRVTVGVRAPRGATIEFPRVADSAATVQSLDPVVIRTSTDSSAVEQYADYRLAAWDVGSQPIKLPDVIVKLGGATRRVPIVDSVFVRSLLPSDTTLRVPKPLRPLFEVKAFPWWLVALAGALAIIGLLVWWWMRRRRRIPIIPAVDPFSYAESEFDRIEKLGLLEAGERGRYVTLMIEVLRDYLAARYAQTAALSLTSTELQRSVSEVSHVPHDRLMRVLTDADLIKFARRPVSTDRARDLGREARSVVAYEHESYQAYLAAQAAEAAATAAAQASPKSKAAA